MRELGKPLPDFPRTTALGALAHYVAADNRNFQPMNVTYGIMEGWPEKVRGGKQARYEKIAERALETVGRLKQEIDRV
jgi:methylenetetrahydrofolate--tRNA-(uracil-5-)-methyltransferase